MYRRAALPLRAVATPFSRTPLPGRYWRHWTTIVLGVAAEFGVMFWAVDFLSGRFGPAGASLALSGFLGMMLLGRMVGTRLAGRFTPERVVSASLLLALGGFLGYWLGSPVWQIVGILVTGFGVANLYPYNIALALGTVSGDAASASARISLGAGGAILLSPIVLGGIADLSSLEVAQGVLPLFLLLALLNLIFLPQETPSPAGEPRTG
jgi:fucose permease